MKNLRNLTMGLVTAFFLVTACDKSEEPFTPTVEKEITRAEMQNKANPQDGEGAQHNDFLDYLVIHADVKQEISREKLVSLYKAFYASQKMEFNETEMRNLNLRLEAFGAMKIGGPYINPDLCKRFPGICNLTGTGPYNPVELLAPSNGGTAYERATKYLAAIRNEETKIMKNDDLTEDEKQIVLTYYAVARHSAAYWHNVAYVQKEKSGWYDVYSEAAAVAPCHLCDIANADASGAVIGGVIAGPPGAGAGAASVSAGVAAHKFLDWLFN